VGEDLEEKKQTDTCVGEILPGEKRGKETLHQERMNFRKTVWFTKKGRS